MKCLGEVVLLPAVEKGRDGVSRRATEHPANTLGSSNTKVSLFQAYSTAVQPFRTVVNTTPMPNPFATLAKLDQEKTCHLHHAGDMVRALTDGIVKMDQIYQCRGVVTAANQAGNVSFLFFFYLMVWGM